MPMPLTGDEDCGTREIVRAGPVAEKEGELVDSSDQQIIERVNQGDPAAFEELLERYEEKIFHFGMRMCGQVEDARDLLQETFLNAFRYLKGFRGEAQFKNWLYKIASSVCIKMRRKGKFEPDFEISLDQLVPTEDGEVPQEIPDWALEPLENVLSKEVRRRLSEALALLPKEYRIVLVLRDMEGFSTEETAETLGISEAAVKSRLHRARLFVRQKLHEYFQGRKP